MRLSKTGVYGNFGCISLVGCSLLIGCSLLVGGSLLIGCAATQAGRFPTQAELHGLEKVPAPKRVAPSGVLDVQEWQLAGPLPDAVELAVHHDATPWQALLEQAAQARGGLALPSEDLHCVARESGRFYLAHQALPAEALGRFIASRCGSMTSDVALAFRGGTAAESFSESAIFDRQRAGVAELIKQQLQQGTQLAGIWFGRDGERVVVMLAVAPRRAQLSRVALVPSPDGTVTIQGELLIPSDHLEALVNRGRFGFGRCTADRSVAMPRFSVKCTVDKADASTWLEVAAFPPGRLVGHVVASLLVWPGGLAASATFQKASYTKHSAPAAEDGRAQLLGVINEVRQGAGLKPLDLAERESETARAVAPHYFGAILGEEAETVADQVVLGLRAGWDVEGVVRYGQFAASLVQGTDDLSRLLDVLLERPSGREVLLDPEARALALGMIRPTEPKVLATVVASYALFDHASHEADVQRLVGRLTKLRDDHHLAPATILRSISFAAAEGAERVQRGERAPADALRQLLNDSSEKLGQAVKGWVLEASSLDQIVFPDELLSQPNLGLAIAVAHRRPKDEPWAHYVVLVVVGAPTRGDVVERAAGRM